MQSTRRTLAGKCKPKPQSQRNTESIPYVVPSVTEQPWRSVRVREADPGLRHARSGVAAFLAAARERLSRCIRAAQYAGVGRTGSLSKHAHTRDNTSYVNSDWALPLPHCRCMRSICTRPSRLESQRESDYGRSERYRSSNMDLVNSERSSVIASSASCAASEDS